MASQRTGGVRKTPTLHKQTADQVNTTATTDRHSEVDALQRSAGNRATALLMQVGQAKLRVGSSDDPFEREADDMAARVVRALGGRRTPDAATDSGAVTDQAVQRVAVVGDAGGELDGATESMISRARSGGEALAANVRRTMESAIGADFGAVRIHTGEASTALNDRVQASAFTIGNDIFFHGGAPDVGSTAGQSLLAHELTHTVQQGASAVRRSTDITVLAEQGVQRKGGKGGKKKPKGKGGGAKPVVDFTKIEEPKFGAEEETAADEVAGEETVVETAVEEDAVEESAPTGTKGPSRKSRQRAGKQAAKAKAEEAQAQLEAEQLAAADASKKAAEAAAAKKQAEDEAAAKALFEEKKDLTIAKMNEATAAARPYNYIDRDPMYDIDDSITALFAAPAPVWTQITAQLKKLYTEAVRIINMAAMAAVGRLGKRGNTIPMQTAAGVSGDGFKSEKAAVKETIDAIAGTGTWNGTVTGGATGKWGAQHGNSENNLPPGGYKEYYVRAPEGTNGFGNRRIVVHNKTGAIYYSSTHYGERGNPPFILLRG
jgi:hypothetical protein